MKPHRMQFLGLAPEYTDFEKAAVSILPFPYEGGISYRGGTAGAPDAMLEASANLELYDEVLREEPYRMGIVTIHPPDIPPQAEDVLEEVYRTTRSLIKAGKFVVLLGGDHSITPGYFRAVQERYKKVSVVQLDAHADLRDAYDGSRFSHACTMARIRDICKDTLQLGIRSLSKEEAKRIDAEDIRLYTIDDCRHAMFDIDTALDRLPDPVYVTVDVDVFDWSVIMSTGTPEPGGFTWEEGLSLLRQIFIRKNVVGFDVVELAYNDKDYNSPFAVAKLIYKMLGFKLEHVLSEKNLPWPSAPMGTILLS
jgi:agmatinase